MPQRRNKIGDLSVFSDKLLSRLLKYMGTREVLSLSGTCWVGYELQNSEEMWRQKCLNDSGKGLPGLLEGKEARFWFKINWKYSYCRPEEHPSTPPPKPIYTRGLPHYKFHTSKKDVWYGREIDVAEIPVRGLRVPEVPASELDLDDFFERYDKGNSPVVVTGVVKEWGWNGWTRQDLLNRHGDTVFKTNGTTVEGKTLRMTFRQYSEYSKAAWGRGEKPLYIFDNKFEERAKSLTKDYGVPPYFTKDLFECMSKKDRPDYKWLLIGPQGSGAPFHTDPHQTHAWNVVTEGRKRIAFYPPRTIPPGVDKKLIHTEYYAAADTMDWYLNHYPKLQRSELPLEAIINPGDMVFIPSGWWHQVINVDPFTIAITQNVCSPGNFPRVWRDLQKRGPKSLAKRFHRDCQAKHKTLFKNYKEPLDMSSSEETESSSSSSCSSESTF